MYHKYLFLLHAFFEIYQIEEREITKEKMLLGTYFVIVSAYFGTWFQSEKGMKSPEQVIDEACCSPKHLLPDSVVHFIALQVGMEHCGQLWCFYSVFYVLYFGWVMMISWLFEIALFSDKPNGLGWGLLMYILIELIFGVFLAASKWWKMIKESYETSKRYTKFKQENPHADIEQFKEEVNEPSA